MKRLGILVILGIMGFWVFQYFGSEVEIKNSPPGAGTIIAFGDSLTAGTGTITGLDYPSQLEERLGREVLNYGVPGETVGEAAERLTEIIEQNPAIVVVLLGGNDYLQRNDMKDAMRELAEIVRSLQATGSMVVLVGLDGLMPMNNIGAGYERIAEENGCVFVPDILDGIYGNPDLMSDRVHPNGQGYALMAERIGDALEAYVF